MRRSLLALALVAFPTMAGAASQTYCTLYARERVKIIAGAYERSEAAAATPASLGFILTKAFYGCLAIDEPPPFPEGSLESDEHFLAHVIAALHNQESGAPVQSPATTPAGPDLSSPTKVKGRRTPEDICGAVKRRVVWTGKHWNCK